MSSLLGMSVLSFSMLSLPCSANISAVPVVGGIVNSSEILKHQINDSITYTTTTVRDAAIFTIAGLTLDAYILSLPLDSSVKNALLHNYLSLLRHSSWAFSLYFR